jgi:hypothetical protein
MGHLMDVSLFVHAENCGMDMDIYDDGASQMNAEDTCCDDELIIVEGQDDLKVSFEDVDLGQQLFLVAFAHYYLNLLQIGTERIVPNEHYPPPLLVKDIQLLDEVFII